LTFFELSRVQNVFESMRQAPPPKTWFQKIEKLHPYETLLYLGMLGSGIIFLFLAVAFLSSGREYLRGLNEQMPLAFLVSTFLLVLSGYTAVKMRQTASFFESHLCFGLTFYGVSDLGVDGTKQ